ncbi:MAG: hemolysin family protein [Ignavibacteria bacterium]|nr:hemolysin family protein [Ignavibacteria bacterium]
MVLNIIITLFFVFLNAFFVAAEFAIVKVRSTQIELKAKKGSFAAKIASSLVANLNEYLSACQLGITIASLALGWIGEPVVSKIIFSIFLFLGVNIPIETAEKISLPLAFVLITILHIVFGELAPKSYAILRAEKTALLVSIPLRIFYFLFKPFIWLLNEFANSTLRFLGIGVRENRDIHSEEEIREILKYSYKLGTLEATKEKLLQNVFDFSFITAKQIMVPRNKIVAIEKNMSIEKIFEKFRTEGYSRMPVYENTIDDIVGVIYAKDLLYLFNQSNYDDFQIGRILRKPLCVKETQRIQDILKLMQREKVHLAIVLDEFGGTAGLITIEDILEELVGEIQDEFDEEQPLIKKLNENEYEINAETPIDEILESLSIEIPKSKEYETIGGYIAFLAGRIPVVGERFYFEDFYIEVVSASERKVGKVKLVLI